MPYIVDGNNVMGQTPGWHRDKDAARDRLLTKLARFARSRQARVTVVFDGPASGAYPEGSAFHGVRILYAERGSDADTRICGLVESSADARGLIVITSDRELASLVHARGARVIRSGEFRRQMEAAARPADDSGGTQEGCDDGSLSDWMRYFGALPEDDEAIERDRDLPGRQPAPAAPGGRKKSRKRIRGPQSRQS